MPNFKFYVYRDGKDDPVFSTGSAFECISYLLTDSSLPLSCYNVKVELFCSARDFLKEVFHNEVSVEHSN